ncbi:MAG TPA: ribonuclease HI [Lachnospiraceae bacterium]|nr:ribonuclease HI [Lachnospiraceae bacterium]
MKVRLFSDGSARGNPSGPGGFGTLLQYTDSKGILHEREYSAGYKKTTNNRMELMGVITGLEALIKPCEVEVVSDSRYVTDAFNKHWIDSWLRSGWVNSQRKPVLNDGLWKRLLKAMEPHKVSFIWVKGHVGHPENERCDRLATKAADSAEETLLIDDGGDLKEE